MDGCILSAVILVDEPVGPEKGLLSEVELGKVLAEMESDSVNVPHADDSTEAIYTRMSGE